MSWFYKHILTRITKAKRGVSSEKISRLSRRERQVFGLIGSGDNRFDVAHIIGIAPSTVYEYRRRIRLKLDVHNDVEIANNLRDRYEKI